MAHKRQDQTEASLNRTLEVVEETNTTGDAILEMFNEQTEKLKKIENELTDVLSEMDLAKNIMRSFLRRLKADKFILMFVILIVLGVLGLVIFVSVKKKK